MQHELDSLVRQAKRVLDFNWTGSYTKPGPRLYPHQWSWDSAFIAIGYACYEQERTIYASSASTLTRVRPSTSGSTWA